MYKQFFIAGIILFLAILLVQPVLGIDIHINPFTTGTSATSTFDQMVDRVLNWLLSLSAVIAVLMIIIGAYLLVVSSGDPEKIILGKKIIIYALVGLAIVLMAKGIVEIVKLILGV